MLKHWFISWRKDNSIFNTGKEKVFFFKKIYAVRSSDNPRTIVIINDNSNNLILIGLAAEKSDDMICRRIRGINGIFFLTGGEGVVVDHNKAVGLD